MKNAKKMRVLYYSLLLAACVAGEGDRFLCVNKCLGVRYVLSVGGAFADRVCRSNDRGEFIKSEILSNRANLVDIPFDFNVTVTRHAVSGCGDSIRRSWDKTAPDSSIQIALVLSTELPFGAIQIAASGATEYAEFFTSENSTFFRRLLDDEDVEVVASYITTTTYIPTTTYITTTTNATTTNGSAVGLVTGYTSTSAPFNSTTAVDATTSTLAATLTPSTTSQTTASQPNNKTSDNRIINDKFIGDDLSKEFLGQKSDSTVLAINLLLTLCAVMVSMTI
jgi:hypothetical protein